MSRLTSRNLSFYACRAIQIETDEVTVNTIGIASSLISGWRPQRSKFGRVFIGRYTDGQNKRREYAISINHLENRSIKFGNRSDNSVENIFIDIDLSGSEYEDLSMGHAIVRNIGKIGKSKDSSVAATIFEEK